MRCVCLLQCVLTGSWYSVELGAVYMSVYMDVFFISKVIVAACVCAVLEMCYNWIVFDSWWLDVSEEVPFIFSSFI